MRSILGVFYRRCGYGGWLLALLLLMVGCSAAPTGLLRPNGIKVAPDGSLYVMDRGNNRVVHLTTDGRVLDTFGRLGAGANQIYLGWDVELDSTGQVYITNQILREDGTGSGHDGVKVFTPDGRLVRELGGQDYTYNDGVPRNSPYDLAIDHQDRVYVANFGTNILQIFNPQGQLIGRFVGETGSEEGQFMGMVAVAVDNQRDLIYLLDHMNGRIQQFRRDISPNGEITLTHLLTFGEYGREPGQLAYPQYMVINESSGRLYVSDMANQRIQVFNDKGEYETQFSPADQVKTWQVLGVALGQDGAVYAVDTLNNVIWVFEPDGRLRARIEV